MRRSTFFQVGQAVYATYLRRLLVETSTLDSLYNYYDAVVEAYGVDTVLVRDDTLRTAYGWGFRLSYADLVDARRNLISGVHAYYPDYYQEAALEAQDVDSVVIYGNRVEANTVRGIIVRGSGSLVAAIDSNVVADDTAFAGIQVHRPATVTRNLITRNTNGIYVADNGGTSVINNNNIEANVTYGLWNVTATAVNAQSNWWNDVAGPRCALSPSLVTGCAGSTGDFVYGYLGNVDYSSVLPARAAGAPTAGPPMSTATASREGRP